MKDLTYIADELFNKIRGRFPSVTIGDSEGKVTNKPQNARFYDFDFQEGTQNLGKISVNLLDDKISLMYSNDVVENQDEITKSKWYDFLKELRMFAKKRLLNFDTRNINKSNLDKRDYKFLATNRPGEEIMSEAKLYGTSKISYQNIGEARLVLKHSQAVNQEVPSGRSQHVEGIYIDSPQGERFKYPFKHINGARALARHVSEGGTAYDDFGKHITSLSEELYKLRKFKNYMGRSSVMAESLAGYVDVVKERIGTVKKTIETLQKPNAYKQAFESFENTVLEEVPTDVAENWIDQLTIKQFNEELKDVFPYIYKLVSEATKAKQLGPEDLDESEKDEEFKPHMMYDPKTGEGKKANKEQDHKDLSKKGWTHDKPKKVKEAKKNCGCGQDPCITYGKIKEMDEIENSFEALMGQFAEGMTKLQASKYHCEDCGDTMHSPTTDCSHDCDDETGSWWKDKNGNGVPDAMEGNKFTAALKKAKDNDDDEMDVDGEKIPVTEFVLSMFDRHSGQFPKGETAILTAVEKDYGEEFINPAKAFIEAINEKYAQFVEASVGDTEYGRTSVDAQGNPDVLAIKKNMIKVFGVIQDDPQKLMKYLQNPKVLKFLRSLPKDDEFALAVGQRMNDIRGVGKYEPTKEDGTVMEPTVDQDEQFGESKATKEAQDMMRLAGL